jgi:hypothetical protein
MHYGDHPYKGRKQMTKVSRFFATCLLVVSLASAALADGGETHGPGLAPPQPTIADYVGNEASCPLPEPSVDAFDVANALVGWLVQSAL